MAFIHVSGPAKTEGFKKTASVAIAAGSALGFEQGYVRQALNSTVRIAGISVRKITSSSDDYADNSVIPVIVPSEDDVFEADVVTGSATQASVGVQYDLGSNTDGTAQGITVSGTTYKVVTVVGFISATVVLVKFNANYAFANKAN